jgi:hypothetical protein
VHRFVLIIVQRSAHLRSLLRSMFSTKDNAIEDDPIARSRENANVNKRRVLPNLFDAIVPTN